MNLNKLVYSGQVAWALGMCCSAALVAAAPVTNAQSLHERYQRRDYSVLADLRALADAGDVQAQADLCEAGLFGFGVPRDETPGPNCRRAAAQGEAYALGLIGMAEVLGSNPQRNIADGLRAAEKGFSLGDGLSAHVLARAYDLGIGRPVDHARALEYLHAGVERGFVRCMYWLGRRLVYGEYGTAPDARQGLALLTKAADAGIPEAQRTVGEVYEAGGPGIPVDWQEGYAYYAKAAAAHDAEASFRIYSLLTRSSNAADPANQRKALEALVNAADGGVPYAMSTYAWRLWHGFDGPPNVDLAIRYYTAAISEGDLTSRLELAELYLFSDKPDFEKSRKLAEGVWREYPGVSAGRRAGLLLAILMATGRAPGSPGQVEQLMADAEKDEDADTAKWAQDAHRLYREQIQAVREDDSNGSLAALFLGLMALSIANDEPPKGSTASGGPTSDATEGFQRLQQCLSERYSCILGCVQGDMGKNYPRCDLQCGNCN